MQEMCDTATPAIRYSQTQQILIKHNKYYLPQNRTEQLKKLGNVNTT
jgi:hypothetical protein